MVNHDYLGYQPPHSTPDAGSTTRAEYDEESATDNNETTTMSDATYWYNIYSNYFNQSWEYSNATDASPNCNQTTAQIPSAYSGRHPVAVSRSPSSSESSDTISPSISTQSGGDKPHICRELVEGRPCLSTFKRKADLQRHICVHHNKDTTKIWYCDAPRCDRNSIGAQGGFTQKDHLTEHLRSYHHHDIPKTRGRGLEDDQPESSTAQQGNTRAEEVSPQHYPAFSSSYPSYLATSSSEHAGVSRYIYPRSYSKHPQHSTVGTSRLNELLRHKTCVVCREDLPIKMFKSRTFTSTCTHETNTCNACLDNWLNESLTSKGWDKITCPECGAPFQHADIKSCATEPQFERYDELATRTTLSATPNFRWCLSPRCRSGQIHDSDNPIFVCVACSFKHCIHHEMPWHEGETCYQYDHRKSERKNRNEQRTQRTIKRTTKKCPGNGCGVNIEKINGCDHMTCKICNHEFCWRCLAPYGPIWAHGNAMHRPSCRHFRPIPHNINGRCAVM